MKTGNIPREWQHGFVFGNSFGRFGLFIGMSSFLLQARSAPTLLGMYIGKLYLKEEIQEDFDLSRWL